MGGVSRRAQPHNIYQADLFAGSSPLQTKLITRRGDFEELFAGFSKMRAISYVVSPDLLLEFFDKRGYQEIKVVVGENLAETYKKNLEQKGVEVTDQLARLVEKDKLLVFISARTIHTKLYILQRDEIVRVIQTSANLTLTAQEARQINYAWYLDIPLGNPILEQLVQDYQSHLHGCTLFMGDLKDLLNQRSDIDRKQVIEAWLKGVAVEEQDVEKIRSIFHDLSVSLVEASDAKEERVTVLQLPESALARKRIERQLAPLKPVAAGQNQVHVNTSAFIRYVYETHRVPLLILSRERQQLLLGLDTPMVVLTEAPSDPALVNRSLELVETYLHTVDSGESPDPLSVKTSMFEALLYIFFAPFAHEYMKARRARLGLMATRGPRFLYIYGPSQNGKTTFLQFALKLLTGRMIEPLSSEYFTKTRIRSVALMETAFPLVFDDVTPSRLKMEEVFKSYWERWWRDQYVSPQIVITSNTPRLEEWAKSRVKRIDFDVHFAPTEVAKEKLAKLFSEDNLIFRWFSYLYLSRLSTDELPSDDELRLARTVMKELYEYARRPLPKFFPAEPIEKLYDPGRRDWRDLLYSLKKATIEEKGNRKLVTFAKDMQPWEIKDYQGYLPQTIKHQRKGNTIIIENPKEFDKWLGKRDERGLFPRLFKSKGA